MKRVLLAGLIALAPLGAEVTVIQNATIMSEGAKGTFKGSIRGARRQDRGGWRERDGAGGRDGDRRAGAVRDPRHYRLPLAYRGRWRRQRGQRFGVVDGEYPRRDQPGGHRDLSRAGRAA